MGKKRERTRVKSRVDELPEELKLELDKMLANVNYTYRDIAEALNNKGFEISKSSVGRYALRQNNVLFRLREAAEQTKVIVETIKENQNLDAASAANARLIDGLTKKFALAQEEFDNMPLDKAARIAVQLERTAIMKEKFKMEYNKGFDAALIQLKKELAAELQKEPELLARMVELADRVANRKDTEE